MPLLGSVASGSLKHYGFTFGRAPTFTDATLADIPWDGSYTDGVSATGTQPITYSLLSGSLPNGITLNSSTGAVTGSTIDSGVKTFNIRARNSLGTTTQSFSKTVPDAPLAPTYVNSSVSVSSGYSPSISVPSGAQVGDIIIVGMVSYFRDTPIGSSVTLSPGPYTWSPYPFQYTFPTNYNQLIYSGSGGSPINGDYIDFCYWSAGWRTYTGSNDNWSQTLDGRYVPGTQQTTTQPFSPGTLVTPGHAWITAILVLRPPAGHTFTASAASAFSINYFQQFNTGPRWRWVHQLGSNKRPKSALVLALPRGISISGTQGVAASSTVPTESVPFPLSLANQQNFTNLVNNSSSLAAYYPGATDLSSIFNTIYYGTYTYSYESWVNSLSIALTWSRS